MTNDNVHVTEPSDRDDLKHTDTVSTGEAGETAMGQEDAPIGGRLERDPSNLGNDIPEEGDLTHPAPINQPQGRMPGM